MSAEPSTLAKVYQNKRLQLPLESTTYAKPGGGWGYPGPVFGLSVGVDEDSQAPETTGHPGGTSSMNQQCLTEGALKLSTYNCQPSASLCQPGGPVRGAGRGRSAGRRFVQARRCLPSPALD